MPDFQSLQAAYKSFAFRQEIKKQYPIDMLLWGTVFEADKMRKGKGAMDW